MAHFLKKEREIKSLKPKESLIKVKNECRGIFFENKLQKSGGKLPERG